MPPCAVKTCAVRPGFARVVAELWAADPNNVQGPVKPNASPGQQSDSPRPRWKPGPEQNPGPENQDSQHMLEQPRGYFPEKYPPPPPLEWGLFMGMAVSCRKNAFFPGAHKISVEPKVRLEGYVSHSSRCFSVLVWQYFEEAFCAPKVRLKWYGFKGFPSHSSHCSGGLFPQYSRLSP